MGLKDLYHSIEEKYYSVLDRLNESVPVYSLIDPIDKIIPSFILFLVMFLLLVGGGAFLLIDFPSIAPEATVTFIVKNEEGTALENTKIFVSGPEIDIEKTTNKSGLATITVPVGIELTVRAEKRNYIENILQIVVGEEEFEVNILLSQKVVLPSEHTVSFARPDSTKIVGKEVIAHFECTNTLVALVDSDYTTTDGEITITPPVGCGLLTVTATSTGYRELGPKVVDLPAKLLTFEAMPLPKGDALFFIHDGVSKQSLNGIKVTIFDTTNFPFSTQRYSDRGEVSFSLEPGNYKALVEDETGEYSSEENSFSISANQSTTQEIFLQKNPAATIKISVIETGSDSQIDGAKVFLKKENGDVFGEREISSENPQAIFSVAERGIYYFIGSHEDYLQGEVEEIDLTQTAFGSVIELEYELEKCALETCGVLHVKVLDEFDEPVENAKVIIFDAETGSIASEFEERVTDFEGKISDFQNVGERELYAVAQKYPASGYSDTILINPLEENELIVRMVIGKGTIEVEAVDDQGTGIYFATAEIMSALGEKIATISLDENGKGIFETKADKSVFVVVFKDGLIQYTSILHQVIKDDKIKIKAELLAELSNPEIEAKFLGVFDETGNLIVDKLSSGKTYFAKIQLLVPKEYKTGGLHFRVGEKQNDTGLSSEALFVKSTNAPLTNQIPGKTFNPLLGEETDYANLALGNAKWVNTVWSEVKPGIYATQFEVVVKQQTTVGTELPIYYRAWGVNSGEEYKRHPLDAELGIARETATKQELYAEAFSQIFFEGSEKICDETFCYSERLFDLKEGLLLTDTPYIVRVFDDYRLEFSITNNSGKIFSDSDIRIKNSADGITTDNTLSMENYSIKNAEGIGFDSTSAVFELENYLDAGNFGPYSSIEGEITIQAKQLKNSGIDLKIVSGTPQGVSVFNKFINFEPVSGQQIEIKAEPEVLAALIPIELKISVNEVGGARDGRPLDGGKVFVKRIDPSFNETIQETTTDALGDATVSICSGAGCSPGTKIVIEVEKPGYAPVSIEKEITDSVVEFSPESLEFNLDVTDVKSGEAPLEILNLIPSSLKIKRILLRGNFEGIADTQRMAAYLNQFVGATEIPFNESRKITVLAALNNEIDVLEESVSPTGSILIELVDSQDKFSWATKEIPLTINVNLGQPVKEKDCLTISESTWTDSTLETSALKEFTIVNNCVSSAGNRLDLENLQATIDWSGEITGQVMLTVTNPHTGETVSELLQQSFPTHFFSSVEAGQEFLATLTFIPKPNKVGREAIFKVIMDAEQISAGGQEFVGASNDISAQLLIINLSKCITTNPGVEQRLELGTEDSGTISISTEDCGEIPISLRLCHQDNGCKGGTEEGGIELYPKTFSNIISNTVDVQVNRQSIPGIYGVKIEARPRGGGWREVGEFLVSINPKGGRYFSLQKYDFSLIGSGTKDSTTLTNSKLDETVTVRATQCDWGEATEKDSFNGTGALIGAGAGFAVGAAMAYSALGAAALEGAVTIAFCPPCAIFAGIGLIIGALIPGLIDDPCEEFMSNDLKDYVINLGGTDSGANLLDLGSSKRTVKFLPPDAGRIGLSDERIQAEWNFAVVDTLPPDSGFGVNTVPGLEGLSFPGVSNAQQVGVVFSNNGLDEPRPSYAVATFTATEHIHGDLTHTKGKVKCDNDNFGFYWIGANGQQGKCEGAFDTTYSQKFHLRFKSNVFEEALPPIDSETLSCISGTRIGRTGEGSLPRIKLNWSWNENAGIAWNSCDEGNPDYVYCDATQFSIEINKRLYLLSEFFKANNYNFSCPKLEDGEEFTEEQLERISEYGCHMTRSTETSFGNVPLLQYIEADSDVVWTNEVPGKEALRNLIIFNSYLMKDSFNEDFKKDFAKYYSDLSFSDADYYFHQLDTDSDGKWYGFNRFWTDEGGFSFTKKYDLGVSELSSPGLYRVELGLYFGEDWRFFENDELVSFGAVVLQKIREPSPNSPFYSVPFDGLVGFEGGAFRREGYGVGFSNQNSEKLLYITTGTTPVKTFESTGSNPLVDTSIEVKDDLFSLNTNPLMRGNILSVDSFSGSTASINFFPSVATPVIMKMNSNQTDNPFGAYYGVLVNENRQNVGDVLTFWSGSGACLDFSSLSVSEAFDDTPDRRALPADGIQNYENNYTVQWGGAERPGDVFLKTIFYTNTHSINDLIVEEPKSGLNFLTPNEGPKQSVGLNGIDGMEFNNKAQTLESVADVFELVKAGNLCVTSTGDKVSFWWNPKVIYEQVGSASCLNCEGLRSIEKEERALEASRTCIGVS